MCASVVRVFLNTCVPELLLSPAPRCPARLPTQPLPPRLAPLALTAALPTRTRLPPAPASKQKTQKKKNTINVRFEAGITITAVRRGFSYPGTVLRFLALPARAHHDELRLALHKYSACNRCGGTAGV